MAISTPLLKDRSNDTAARLYGGPPRLFGTQNMIPMKKLRSSGVPGANEGYIRRGREFMAANEHRAKELEEAGLAVRLNTANDTAPGSNPEILAGNKAASTGPLLSVGGETGAENAPLSSDQDHQPRQRRSKKSDTALGL